MSVKFAIDTLEKETLHTFLDVQCIGTQPSPLFLPRLPWFHPIARGKRSRFRLIRPTIELILPFLARRKFQTFEFVTEGWTREGRVIFRSRAPVRFTYIRGSRSIMTSQLARVSRARTRRSGVRPVTVNKSSCAPHRAANRSRVSPREGRAQPFR